MGLNEKFDMHSVEEYEMDSVEEYEMEEELQHFLNCEDSEYVDAEKNTAMELCEFYFGAVGELLGRDKRWSDAKNVRHFFYNLRSLTDPWCRFKKSCKEEQKLLEDTLYYRIAYIYRNSTCISSAVAHHFRTFLDRNPHIRNELLKKRELRICSVGGGSPCDVVALVQVLESNVDVEDELDIHVSIIGGNKKWLNTSLVVLRCLARFRNTIWKIDFLQTDLLHPLSDEVTKAIESADIISVVKVFSELERGYNTVESKSEMFQKVHRLSQPGSVVFCLDLSHSHAIRACGGYLGFLPQHCLRYEVVCDLYALDETVVEKHFRLYSDEFPGHICNTAFLVFCRVWLKPSTNTPRTFHLKPLNSKFIKMQEQLEEAKKQERELRRKFQLFQDSELNSFKLWKDSTDLEMRNKGRTKRQRNQAIRVAECALRQELKSRRKLMNSLCSERVRTALLGQKELCDKRKNLVASKRDSEEVKLKIHQQSIRVLVESFKLK